MPQIISTIYKEMTEENVKYIDLLFYILLMGKVFFLLKVFFFVA